jgi:hypothetical protein
MKLLTNSENPISHRLQRSYVIVDIVKGGDRTPPTLNNACLLGTRAYHGARTSFDDLTLHWTYGLWSYKKYQLYELQQQWLTL